MTIKEMIEKRANVWDQDMTDSTSQVPRCQDLPFSFSILMKVLCKF